MPPSLTELQAQLAIDKSECRVWMLRLRGYWRDQKNHAKRRNVVFLLSFEEWLHIWIKSGKLKDRGRKAHQYCMSRKGDKGPYVEGNIEIKTVRENTSEASLVERRPRGPRTKEHCENIAKALRGKKLSDEHIQNMKTAHALRLGKIRDFV